MADPLSRAVCPADVNSQALDGSDAFDVAWDDVAGPTPDELRALEMEDLHGALAAVDGDVDGALRVLGVRGPQAVGQELDGPFLSDGLRVLPERVAGPLSGALPPLPEWVYPEGAEPLEVALAEALTQPVVDDDRDTSVLRCITVPAGQMVHPIVAADPTTHRGCFPSPAVLTNDAISDALDAGILDARCTVDVSTDDWALSPRWQDAVRVAGELEAGLRRAALASGTADPVVPTPRAELAGPEIVNAYETGVLAGQTAAYRRVTATGGDFGLNELLMWTEDLADEAMGQLRDRAGRETATQLVDAVTPSTALSERESLQYRLARAMDVPPGVLGLPDVIDAAVDGKVADVGVLPERDCSDACGCCCCPVAANGCNCAEYDPAEQCECPPCVKAIAEQGGLRPCPGTGGKALCNLPVASRGCCESAS